MNKARSIVLGALLLAAQHSSAAVTQWGVSAVSAHADCSLAFPCNIPGLTVGLWFPETHGPAGGGLNQTSGSQLDVAHVHETLLAGTIDMGRTSSQVQLDNTNVGVPVLKAKAQSFDDNGWVSGIAFGIQGYQYTGSTSTTLQLGANLSGTIANPNASDVSGFSIGIWLLRPDPALVFPPGPMPTLGQFVASVIASTQVAASWTPPDVTATGAATLSTGASPLAITLDPGSEFYLMAGLAASATGSGTSADAFGTLTMNFANASNLVAAGIAPVPEPQIYILMLAGLCLVAWRLRFAGQHRLAG